MVHCHRIDSYLSIIVGNAYAIAANLVEPTSLEVAPSCLARSSEIKLTGFTMLLLGPKGFAEINIAMAAHVG